MYTIILNEILICKTNLKVTYPEWLIWKVNVFTTYDAHIRDNDPDYLSQCSKEYSIQETFVVSKLVKYHAIARNI